MRLRIGSPHLYVIAAALASAIADRAAEPMVVKPLSVCEVLADIGAYSGKKIAVLGKFEGGSMIDGCCALVQDRCKQSVVTDTKEHGGIRTGYAWQNRIDLAKLNVTGDDLSFDSPEFREKLRQAGIWTHLNCYDAPVQRPDVSLKRMTQRWAVANGTLRTNGLLHGPTGSPGTLSFSWGNGFGHLGEAPTQLEYTAIKFIGSDECPDRR
jgi:hypothetical protein